MYFNIILTLLTISTIFELPRKFIPPDLEGKELISGWPPTESGHLPILFSHFSICSLETSSGAKIFYMPEKGKTKKSTPVHNGTIHIKEMTSRAARAVQVVKKEHGINTTSKAVTFILENYLDLTKDLKVVSTDLIIQNNRIDNLRTAILDIRKGEQVIDVFLNGDDE